MSAAAIVSAVTLTVNGARQELELDTRTTLLDLLCEELGATGTKKGCEQGQCGACTVLLDGRRTNACLILAVTCEGAEVLTVEGLAAGGELHPLQRAVLEHDGLQCGYCTPGQLCSAVGMLEELEAGWPSAVTEPGAVPELSGAEIRERMAGNLCRCGAYANLAAAIVQAGAQR